MRFRNILFFLLLIVLSFSLPGLAMDVYWDTPIEITSASVTSGPRTFTVYLKVVDAPLPELKVIAKIDGTQVYERILKKIPKGALRKIRFDANVGIGKHKVQFVIDPANVTGDTNPGNNTIEKSFNVFLMMKKPTILTLLPDLSVFKISTYPITVQEWKDFSVSIIYKNSGPISITSSPKIHLKMNGTVIKTWTVPSPLPSGNVKFLNWTLSSDHGEHTFEVVLDPDNIVTEKNEVNNSASIKIKVYEPAVEVESM